MLKPRAPHRTDQNPAPDGAQQQGAGPIQMLLRQVLLFRLLLFATATAAKLPPTTPLDMARFACGLVLADYSNFTNVGMLRDWQAANAIDSYAMFAGAAARVEAAAVAGAAAEHRTRTRASAILTEVFELVTSTPDPKGACLGGWGSANDDQQWGLFAWMRAYQLTNDTRFVIEAGR